MLGTVTAAILALIAANSLAYFSLQRTLINRIDASLRTVALPSDAQTRGPRFPSSFAFKILAPDGTVLSSVDATNDQNDRVQPIIVSPLNLAGTSADPNGAARFFTTNANRGDSRFRVKAAKFSDGRTLILAALLDDSEDTLGDTLNNQLLITAGVAALVGALSFWLVRRSLRPLAELQHTAAEIGGGTRTARVNPSGSRDVHLLGSTFNTMVDQLDSAITAQAESAETTRRFVDDAAHELRTPTTAIVAYAQLLNSKTRTAEEIDRIGKAMATESERLRHLVDDLLQLARSDQTGGPDEPKPESNFHKVDLAPIALHAVDASHVVRPSYPIELVAPDDAHVFGSESELRRVFDNLLTNIRTHTPDGTSARIAIVTTSREIIVSVQDNGPGLDSKQLGHMFDRFWRSDQSRTRATGGNGLGLSIVKSIIEQHQGTISASSQDGLTIEFRIPTTP